MIEIIQNIIDLITQFINYIFNFQIEFSDNVSVSIGIVVVAFVFFVLALYIVLRALKVIGDDN